MGVILAGSGVGGLVIAPVLQVLLDKYGVGCALRTLGIWNLVIGVPVSCVIRHRPGFGFHRGRSAGTTRINMALIKKGTFLYQVRRIHISAESCSERTRQATAAFLQAAGNVIPMYFMTSYAVSLLGLPHKTGSILLAVNSGINSVSRVSMGILADRVGRQNTMIVAVGDSSQFFPLLHTCITGPSFRNLRLRTVVRRFAFPVHCVCDHVRHICWRVQRLVAHNYHGYIWSRELCPC